MKSRMNFYILAGALVLFILLTASCACCDFKPHTKKAQHSKYEGNANMEDVEDEEVEDEDAEDAEEVEDEDAEDEDAEGFSEYTLNLKQDDEENDKDDKDEEKGDIKNTIMKTVTNIGGKLGLNKTEESMTNKLEPRPYSDNDLQDVFGQTIGSLDCGAKSAGLSNSKGPLCLNAKQLSLLTTRGGNAHIDAQIGS